MEQPRPTVPTNPGDHAPPPIPLVGMVARPSDPQYLPAYLGGVEIAGRPYRLMIADTGACTSLITKAELTQLGAAVTRRTPATPHACVEAVNGATLVFHGRAHLQFQIGGVTFEHEFEVMESLNLNETLVVWRRHLVLRYLKYIA